jgi:hypothetical protein
MGFLRWLRTVASTPDYVRNMTPEERAERRRRDANLNMFGIQIFDMPTARPYKAPKPVERRDDDSPEKA